MNNGISVQYPRTSYFKLNHKIKDYVLKKIDEFTKIAAIDIQEKKIYTLDISHDEYNYNDLISFVLYSATYTGGAHPNHSILTIVYDTLKDDFINITDLINNNPAILEVLSKESRKILEKNEKIVDREMLLEGTKPIVSNFSNFAFSSTGLVLFFQTYQVAPYSSGSFKIVIPYSLLEL